MNAESLLKEVVELQRKHYGDATALHLAMSGWTERASTLIAELGQEVGAVPNGKLVAWWNGIAPGRDGLGLPSIRWGADAENSGHDIPLYDGYNPIHYVTPPASPAHTSEARDAGMANWIRDAVDALNAVTTSDFGGPRLRDINGRNWWDVQDELLQAVPDAAMRQEGGSDAV